MTRIREDDNLRDDLGLNRLSLSRLIKDLNFIFRFDLRAAAPLLKFGEFSSPKTTVGHLVDAIVLREKRRARFEIVREISRFTTLGVRGIQDAHRLRRDLGMDREEVRSLIFRLNKKFGFLTPRLNLTKLALKYDELAPDISVEGLVRRIVERQRERTRDITRHKKKGGSVGRKKRRPRRPGGFAQAVDLGWPLPVEPRRRRRKAARSQEREDLEHERGEEERARLDREREEVERERGEEERARPKAAGAKPRAEGTVSNVIRRTPHMDVPAGGGIKAGMVFKVAVYADKSPPRPGERSEEIALRARPRQRRFTLDVQLEVSQQLSIVGSQTQSVVIERDKDRSGSAVFDVCRGENPVSDPVAIIMAYFSYRGRPSGRVSRTLEFRPTTAPSPSGAKPMDALNIDLYSKKLDLIVQIRNPSRDLQRFTCVLSGRRVPTPPGQDVTTPEPWGLPRQSETLVGEYMQGFVDADADLEERVASLEGAGQLLFTAAPENFKKVFWDLWDTETPLKTILIVSEDPFIPWELMIPNRIRPDGKREVLDKPLGVQSVVGRWSPLDFLAPKQSISIRDSLVIAPQYPKKKLLQHAESESKMVRNQFKGRAIKPANLKTIKTVLGKRGATLLHFVCHGRSGVGKQVIDLEGRNKTLNSIQVRAIKEFATALRRNPVVFMNVCEIGRPQPTLSGVGGFAQAFMEMGASAIIAPLWSVKDSIAHEVAEQFYRTLAAHPKRPFAAILGKIRERAYTTERGEDSYAAYCFYGDPLASLAK